MKAVLSRLLEVLRTVGLSVALAAAAVPAARAERLALPPALIDLGSAQGAAMFAHARAKRAYWPLADEFVTQKAQSYCGIASLAMVLNALGVPAPVVPDYGPFTSFTQENLFTPMTEKIIRQADIPNHGMTLDQVGAVATSFGVTVRVVHAESVSVAQFRTEAAAALAEPGHFVIVNYLRTALGQQRYGHISPLGAYDRGADRFLILDVARYKYPPVWVRSADLFAAMNTVDAGNGNRTRGYLLLDYRKP